MTMKKYKIAGHDEGKCAGIATVDVSEVTLDNLPINVKTESKCEVLSK